MIHEYNHISESLKTTGEYRDEGEAATHFDEIVSRYPNLFRLEKEVCGQYIQPRFLSEEKDPRIDRILMPNPGLTAAGWRHGPIGVEIKTSRKKAGPVINQSMDYTRAIWELPRSPGFWFMLEWVFIWPLDGASDTIESVMTGNRIGSVSTSTWAPLSFKVGGNMNAIVVRRDGTVETKFIKAGRKRGSR